MDDPFAGLGEALERLRVRKRMSQANVEKAGGLSQNSLSRYEGGKTGIKVETLGKIVRGLGVELSELAAEIARVQGREPPPDPEGGGPRVGGLALSEDAWAEIERVADEAAQMILSDKLRAAVRRHKPRDAAEED